MTGAPSRTLPPDAIAREAAAWFARLRADDVTGDNRRTFEAWLAGDARHRAAYARFEQFWSDTGAYAGSPAIARVVQDVARESGIARTNAPGLRIGYRYAVAAVVIAAVAAVLVLAMQGSDGGYQTGVGELRTVALDDGSRITLNTDTRITVAYSNALRLIHLERGQAYFRVTGDAARPFEVATERGRVRALGTEFDVYAQDEEVVVTLVSGKVAVRSAAAPSSSASPAAAAFTPERILSAGERIALAEDRPSEVQAAPVERSTAWLSGKLMFNDEPLGRAVAEVNRYSTDRILVADESLATLRISGVFRTAEPAEFIHAITTYFPLQATRDTAGRYLLTRR